MPSDSQDYLNALAAGHKLQEYVIQSVLGMGGFGITYLAHDGNLNMRVAIKEYLPASLAVRMGDSTVHPKSVAEAETYRWGLNRFMLEAQTLARFRHPNIVRVMRFFEGNGTAYMVMEYEDGQNLAAYLQARPAAKAEPALLQLLMPLLDGLKHVHAQNFMHRDIKPTNIFIRWDGTPVLLDFGSARLAVGGKAQHLTTVYTPGYAPFEQYFSDGKQGPWTDIYALGAILYGCVTGAKPVDAAARVKKDTMVPAVTAGAGRFSAAFLRAIDAALTINEEQRPQSVQVWQSMLPGAPALQAVTHSHAPVTAATTAKPTVGNAITDKTTQMDRPVTQTMPQKPQHGKGNRRIWLVAVSLLVLAVALGLGLRHRSKLAAEQTAAHVPTALPAAGGVPIAAAPVADSPTANATTVSASAPSTATEGAGAQPVSPASDDDAKKIAQRFAKADTNGDGYLSRDEAKKGFPFLAMHFDRFDTDGDGRWSLAEVTAAHSNKQKLILENRAQAAGKRR